VNKQTLVVVVGAVVILGLGILGAVAFTGDTDASPMMTMEDGSTMPTDEMSDTSESDETMTNMDMTP
jgi:amino acid transporter